MLPQTVGQALVFHEYQGTTMSHSACGMVGYFIVMAVCSIDQEFDCEFQGDLTTRVSLPA
jgi:hypothetical protein